MLVVEDSHTQATGLRLILESEGFDVDVAQNGQEGLARCRDTSFDLVLSDVIMPELNGLELCRAIRDDPNTEHLPVILVTQRGDQADIIKGLEAGADNYVIKPYEPQYLLARIEKVLNIKRARAKDSHSRKGETEVEFMGSTFTIASDRDKILNHLVSAFEDSVGSTLQEFESELAQQALRHGEDHFRSLIENAPDIITLLDATGTIQYLSPSAAGTLGYAANELVGKNVLPFVHQDDMAEVRTILDRAVRRPGTPRSVEFRFRHKDRSWRKLESVGTGLVNHPSLAGVVVNSRDVTERHALELQLRHMQKMEAVGQLTGGIAHDFKNLLTVIMTHTQFVADALVSDGATTVTSDLETIQQATESGTAMIQKLMAFSRRDMLQFKPVNIGEVVSNAAGMLKRVLREDIDLRVDADPSLGTVLADPSALEQVLLNLVNNSSDAMPDGGTLRIELSLSSMDKEDCAIQGYGIPGEYACVRVSDTGTGMDDVTRQKIFEPFYTTKPSGEGTGLGMAVIYGMVKQHGGLIQVNSEIGHGTSIEVYLPLAPAERDMPPRGPEGPKHEIRGGTETVLVVEDVEPLRMATKRVLEHHGYAVMTATDGQDALDMFRYREENIDLIVTDMVMPKLGGYGLYEAVRRDGSEVEFLFVSGYSPEDLRERATLKSDAPILTKPWTPTELTLAVRQRLDRVGAHLT